MARIAFVLPGFPRHAGGGHKIVYEYSNYLAAQGHDVILMHLRPKKPGDHSRSRWRRGIIFLAYFFGRNLRPTWYPIARNIRVINASSQNSDLIPLVDILVATSVKTAAFVDVVTQARRAHGAYFIQHFEDYADTREVVESTWRLPLKKIVVAPWLAEKAVELGVQALVVPNAVSAESFPVGPAIPTRPLAVLALVSEQPWKRTDLVVAMMSGLAETVPSAELHTFGVCRRPQGLPAGVIHHRDPTATQLRSLYQNTRVYVCASDYEGFGLPPAEAMMSGAAVVTTENHGVRGFADENVLYVPTGDATALVKATMGLLLDEESCTRLAVKGHRHISSWTGHDSARAFESALFHGDW